MKVIDVPISKIHFEDRHRRDMGDMEGLAANIREMGLLQPIGIDEFFNLIYGMRRLEACESLGWKQIPCVVVKLKSVIAGEYAENVFRKDFTKSERAAIGKAIQEELGNRQGERTDFPAFAGKSGKGETVDIAAQRAGFKSAETFERAKAVIEKGAFELVAAMDKGEISIDAAAKIATQPQVEQRRIVELPKDEQREVVRQIRKTRANQEADERRAYDIRIFRGLNEAVTEIAGFHVSAKETWAGLERVSAFQFSEHLDRAIACLVRLQKEHPNAPKRPEIVVAKTTTKAAN
jgi:ParB family chromosome partitioning protein